MSIDLEDWKQRIAEIGAATEPKLYLGDVNPFRDYGVPDFMAHPTREFAILPVAEAGENPDRIIERNREVIEAVAGTGLRAYQLVVEWESFGVREPGTGGHRIEPGAGLRPGEL